MTCTMIIRQVGSLKASIRTLVVVAEEVCQMFSFPFVTDGFGRRGCE